MTTPVDELRAAATRVRELADAAPKGPWSVEYFGDRGYPQRVTNAQATLIANTYEGGTGLRPIPEYIRLMNPLVGLGLADALDHLAARHAVSQPFDQMFWLDRPDTDTGVHPLLALARLLLGGDS